MENHPRLIRARQNKPVPQIVLDPKTGLPIVNGQKVSTRGSKGKQISTIEEDDEDDEDRRAFHTVLYPCGHLQVNPITAVRVTITRPKNESKEEKKQRKQAVKAERQTRRVDKKATKEQFTSEIKQQNRRLSDKDKAKVRKL